MSARKFKKIQYRKTGMGNGGRYELNRLVAEVLGE
jgi:hypothetical protein